MIPEDIKEDVYKITKEVIKYKNIDNLSWMEVYKTILTNLGMEEKINDDILLIYTVKCITRQGYDIIPIPFKLKRF